MTKTNHVDKPFKKRKVLIKLLSSRQLSIKKRDKTLNTHSYYYLINGYSKVFYHQLINGIPDYTGASIEDFKVMESFDFELRTRLLKEILKLENRIKNHVFYVFAANHGDQDYLIPGNFDTFGNISKKGQVYSLLSKLNNKISQNSARALKRNHPAFAHYLINYDNIPPWVLKLELSLGELSKFYSNLQSPVRQTIAKDYLLSEKFLGTLLYFLSQVRNKCAHNERIFDSKIITLLPANKYHTHFQLTNKNDFFSILIALKFLMKKEEYIDLIQYVDEQLIFLTNRVDSSFHPRIYSIMGLTANWKDISTI